MPFGVDHLIQLLRAIAEGRLMRTLAAQFRQTGNTLRHEFLGTVAYGTIEPANISAILTRRDGQYLHPPLKGRESGR
jgi:hypothetical protein